MADKSCAKCGKRVRYAVPCSRVDSGKLGCPRCLAALYCSEACFRRDWRRHRQECANDVEKTSLVVNKDG